MLKTPLRQLKAYSLHKELTVEEAARFIGKDYSTALRTNNRLEKQGLIRLVRLVRSPKKVKGKEKRIFKATFLGLITYLLTDPEAFKQIDKIAEAHNDMLLILKKWSKFKEAGLEEPLASRLKEALRLYYHARFVAQPQLFGFALTPEAEENQKKAFDYTVLGFQYMLYPPDHIKEELQKLGLWENLAKIWKIVENDYELRSVQREFLNLYESQYMEGLNAIKLWKEQLRQIIT